ncbi:MAG: enoyl-CoA hydratase/isomerase family protein [Ignavibacteriales bacterium]|nr:enoyl-CoA hydratase/isomerase family protein [Ignavibacteriales bacterium]
MQFIEVKNTDGVALVTLNHANENRLSGPFVAEQRQTLHELAADPAVKSVVITGGHEKFFCNGLDLGWMMANKTNLVPFLLEVTQLLKDTAIFPKPLIGAINGHAFGLGAIWSSGFDFRFMRADRGWVCFPEMDINIPFLPGMIAICEHGLGKVAFREMAFTAKKYTGPEAVTVGYAREAVGKDELVPRAMELAAYMAKKAQPAFSLTKIRWAAEVARIIDELDPAAIEESPLPGT